MGMFDTICWRRTAPRDPPSGVEFQSKDIYASMHRFEVREDGSLWILKSASSSILDFLEDTGDAKCSDNWKDRPLPKWERCLHSGSVYLYDGYDGDELHYMAVFDKGQLVWVTKTDDDEYYRPHTVHDRVIKLIKCVLQRSKSNMADLDRNDLEEAVLLLRVT